jgi:hypothetical protein
MTCTDSGIVLLIVEVIGFLLFAYWSATSRNLLSELKHPYYIEATSVDDTNTILENDNVCLDYNW